MNEMELMDALTNVRGEYILDAAPKRKRSAVLRLLPRLGAAAAILAAAVLFFQTAPGAAAAEFLRERVTDLIGLLFPDKVIVTTLEGMPEANTYEAKGQEPEAVRPGFAIYVDPDHYEMTREGEITYIRPRNYDPEKLPICEMEIRYVPEKEPAALGAEIRESMSEDWMRVSELWQCSDPAGFALDASQGLRWNDTQEGHYFVSDGMGGSFHIILRYFLEATEGHGTRFRYMLNTFRVIAPQDGAGYADAEQALLEAARQEVAFVREQAGIMRDELMGEDALSQADRNALNADRYRLWLRAMERVWGALEQSLEEDALRSLTLEQLEWSAGKRSIQDRALAELGDGDLSAAVYFGTGCTELEQRVNVLMMYLDGTLPVPHREGSVPDAADSLRQIARAYFSGAPLTPYLSREAAESEPCPFRDAELLRISGTDNVVADMADRGWLNASAAFRVPGEDSESDLAIPLLWEDGAWKAASCDPEK